MAKLYLAFALIAASLMLISGCTQPELKPIAQGQDSDGTFWRGAENPKLVVYEYSDFECPVCKTAQLSLKSFLSDYQDKGVRLEYRNFPLEQIHPNARAASVASVCAGRDGKFWEMHDLLYEKSPQLSHPELVQYGQQLGLSPTFESCLSDPTAHSEVDADLASGMLRGVQGTPTYDFGGIMISGNHPPETLKQAADRALAAQSS